MTTAEEYQAKMQQLMKTAADQGRLIEAGWLSLRLAAIDPDASEHEIETMRTAFFAGAQHLFVSLMGVMDEGAEPTDADMQRLVKINSELDEFISVYAADHMPTRGTA